jgi:hypothetical protein
MAWAGLAEAMGNSQNLPDLRPFLRIFYYRRPFQSISHNKGFFWFALDAKALCLLTAAIQKPARRVF